MTTTHKFPSLVHASLAGPVFVVEEESGIVSGPGAVPLVGPVVPGVAPLGQVVHQLNLVQVQVRLCHKAGNAQPFDLPQPHVVYLRVGRHIRQDGVVEREDGSVAEVIATRRMGEPKVFPNTSNLPEVEI